MEAPGGGAPGAEVAPASITPSASTEDIGQVAVVRDEGDLVLTPNAFDLRAVGVAFARNGSGGYDVRRSDRPFQSAVGEKITLGDDESARLTLPFTFPFYAGRYAEAFVNSDGNVTFVVEEHASTDRNVARFLTGPPRIAPVFDDLDPSQAGSGVFRRTDGDALLLTWCDVPEFDSPANRVNVQLRLASDGSIDFIYGATVNPSSAVVGVSPGETGIFSPVDVSTAAAGDGRGRQRGDRRALLDHPGARFRGADAEVLRDPRRRFRSARDLHQHENDAAGHVRLRVHGGQRGQRHRPRHLRLEPRFRQPRPAAEHRRHRRAPAVSRRPAAAVSR